MLTIIPLITIPNHYPAQGQLAVPRLDQYVGYYDSGHRQLVFVFERELWMAKIYLSTQPWGSHIEMRDGRLPQNVILGADEAQWLFACWQAAMLRFKRSALENVMERELFGVSTCQSNRPDVLTGNRGIR